MNDIATYAARLGDDALIMGQRLCEWSSFAPVLEEDLALSNTALDYLGRARMFYGYAGQLSGHDEDYFAYLRDAPAFQNLLMVELPRGDFAFTMVRQYLLDVFETAYFDALVKSTDEMLAGIAGKAVKETVYHLRRSEEWMRRLGLGTQESNTRAQVALNELWGYTGELFYMDELESKLAESGTAVDREALGQQWRDAVATLLGQVELVQPSDEWQVSGGRSGVHTEYLGHMLAELQFMQRAYPDASW